MYGCIEYPIIWADGWCAVKQLSAKTAEGMIELQGVTTAASKEVFSVSVVYDNMVVEVSCWRVARRDQQTGT